jgi:hypothetical protein
MSKSRVFLCAFTLMLGVILVGIAVYIMCYMYLIGILMLVCVIVCIPALLLLISGGKK